MRCVSHIVTPEFEELLKGMAFQEIADLMEVSSQNILWKSYGFRDKEDGLWLIAELVNNGERYVRITISHPGYEPLYAFMHAGPFTVEEIKQPWVQATLLSPDSRLERIDKVSGRAGDLTSWWR